MKCKAKVEVEVEVDVDVEVYYLNLSSGINHSSLEDPLSTA